MLQAMFLSPVIAALFALAMVSFARVANKPKAKISTLVWLSLLFALVGAGASLLLTIAWMTWYEKSTGFSAGNAPLGWIFFYGPFSAALGQLLALTAWWFRKPVGGNRGGTA
jgi:hypothetical protein